MLRTHPPRQAPPADDPAVDDAELVALAQRDRQAFALLYRRYVRDVFQFCDRRLGERAAAEDASGNPLPPGAAQATRSTRRLHPPRLDSETNYRSAPPTAR